MSSPAAPPASPPAVPPPAGQPAAPPPAVPGGPVPLVGRSRPGRLLAAHLVWEGALLFLALVVTVVVASQTELFSQGVGGMWFTFASLGLLASGLAMSVRTATPNLAVAGLAGLAGAVYARLALAGWPAALAGLVAVLAVLALGLLLGLVTGLTAAPAWAVSLAGLAACQAVLVTLADSRLLFMPRDASSAAASGLPWALLLILGSLAGGALWQIPALRRGLGANRPAADPAAPAPHRLSGALVGLGGSSLLAALSGIVTVKHYGSVGPTIDGNLVCLALGAVLLGGVSALGRRSGVAGTVLASWLLVTAGNGLVAAHAPEWLSRFLLPAVAVLIGLVLTRTFERLGGPEPASRMPAVNPYAPPPGFAPPPSAPETFTG